MPKFKQIFLKALAIVVIFTLGFSLFPIPKSVAAGQFSTGYDIVFDFGDDGVARVTHNVTLTNLTKDYFASEYCITTGSDKVSDVSGNDALGSLRITTTADSTCPQVAGSTVLIAKLNQQAVGQNKSVKFTISYSVAGLARKNGSIWEVSVPQIVTNENLTSYKLTINIPKSYGTLGKMTPTADQVSDGAKVSYIFTKNPNSAGVFATFGDYQVYQFTLKYRYKNKNLYSAKATIALPPDTAYQAMNYTSIEPKAVKSYTDSSGNYLADYIVKGNSSLEITAKGFAKITDNDKLFQNPQTYDSTQLTKFTKNDKYIDSQNAQIQKKAKELAGPKEIYDYVATTLKYDYSRLQSDSLGRRGSLNAINQPDKSICTDFSDLFVALARAKGIPSRGLVGYAYTDNTTLRPTKIEGLVDTTILHAWPEYYDKASGQWVQVDPTWSSTTGGIDYFTKLDTNHFVFAINGESSEDPLPAGAYKTSAKQNDDVSVEFAKVSSTVKPEVTLTLNKSKVISGFPQTAKLTVENKTGQAIFDSTLVLKSGEKTLGVLSDSSVELGTILPLEKREVQIKLRSSSLLDNKNVGLETKLLGKAGGAPYEKQINNQIKVKPFFSFEPQQIALLIVLLLVAVSFLYPYYYRFRHK